MIRLSKETQKVIRSISYERMEKQVGRVLKRKRIQALTKEWYSIRKNYLTASDMAAVLGISPFSTSTDVYRKKKGTIVFSGNKYTRHGQKYEREASVVYSKATGLDLVEEDIGFLVHEHHTRYGATPDFITKSGILVEIKCPYKRSISHRVPKYYMPQVQFQLEVCGLNTAHFVQYYPPGHKDVNGTMEITVIERDPLWWMKSVHVFDEFMDKLEGVCNIVPRDHINGIVTRK